MKAINRWEYSPKYLLCYLILMFPAFSCWTQVISLHEASYINMNYKNKMSALDPLNRTIVTGHESFDHYLNLTTNQYFFKKLTLKLNTQVNYDKSKPNYYSWNVKELYVGIDAGNVGTFTLGRSITDWGKCYYKKPAAILDPQVLANDITDVRNINKGVDLIQWEYYFSRFSLDAVAINSVDNFKQKQWNFVFRVGTYWKFWEFNLIAAHFYRLKTRLGLAFTSVFGDYVEFHGEYLFTENERKSIYDISKIRRTAQNNHEFSCGLMLTPGWFNRDVRIILEYAFNYQGYTATEWDHYKIYLNNQYRNMFNISEPSAAEASILYQKAMKDFQTERLVRHILFGTVDNLPSLLHISVQPIVLFAPQDMGFIGILNFNASIQNQMTLYCHVNYYGGKKGSIYQTIPYRHSVLLGISFQFDSNQ